MVSNRDEKWPSTSVKTNLETFSIELGDQHRNHPDSSESELLTSQKTFFVIYLHCFDFVLVWQILTTFILNCVLVLHVDRSVMYPDRFKIQIS